MVLKVNIKDEDKKIQIKQPLHKPSCIHGPSTKPAPHTDWEKGGGGENEQQKTVLKCTLKQGNPIQDNGRP